MYWWTKPDSRNYRLISGVGVPYLSTHLLKLGDECAHIDESRLTFRFDEDSRLPIADFLCSGLHPILVCRPEIVLLFGDILSKNFFRYRGIVDNASYFFLACQNEHECFDYDRSEFDRYDLPPPRNRISTIKRLYVNSEFKTADSIFRVGDEWSCKYELIVDKRFKEIYDRNHLTGLNFFQACLEE